LAEAIKAKRTLEAQSTAHGFVSNVKCKIGFLSYFKHLVDKKFDSNGNHGNWLSTYRHLHDFLKGNDIAIERIDECLLESFKEYLLTIAVQYILYWEVTKPDLMRLLCGSRRF
jgi:serine phosphatase RsbU (regulator of sigma subunit)